MKEDDFFVILSHDSGSDAKTMDTVRALRDTTVRTGLLYPSPLTRRLFKVMPARP